MRRPFRVLLGIIVCLHSYATFVGELSAQSRQEHTVQRLQQAEVGPYRPERRPDMAEVARGIVERVDRFREEHSRSPLTTNDELEATARDFAEFMARKDLYGHRADDRTPSERATAQEYEFCIVSENIAYQFRTTGFSTAELAEQFVQGWKDSPPHRENMLDPDVTETGVAIAQSEATGVFYAVQMFGRPKSAAIEFRIRNESGNVVVYRLGERRFELPPRFTRTHRECRPEELTLLAEAAEGERRPLDRARPKSGDTFVIRRGEDGELFLR